jgi:siroheme synthase
VWKPGRLGKPRLLSSHASRRFEKADSVLADAVLNAGILYEAIEEIYNT